MLENKEIRFEKDIETSLTTRGGWTKLFFSASNYDAEIGLDLTILLDFIAETQPKQWERYQKVYGSEAQGKFVKRLNEEIRTHGMLHVLRNGIKDRGIALKLVYFKPVSGLNEMTIKRYQANRFTCTRQFVYSSKNRNTIDMVLAVNGLPLVALELKNEYTGQTVEDGKIQFQKDRDPKELVFQFNKRFLVYFAADHNNVFMTTKLAGKKTYFLPFNQGSNGAGNVGGKGNPVNQYHYPTSYLWEEVLTADNLMDIIQRFMNYDEAEEKLIFPRYHQLDVVRKLVADVKEQGSGKNYLIQHSAGSGKSNSIAWLAYHLSSVHDKKDRPIFASTIIVTDRTVLDRQLQNTIMSFDHTVGQVETIDDKKSSQDLKEAINDGKKIIITTLQKFPVIYQEVDEVKGRHFAIIVDEAHSSQTGNSAQKLKIALADTREALKEYQELEAEAEENKIDDQDQLVQILISQGRHKNLSFFAFTATPKEKTVDMFGTLQPDGKTKAPFHVYSMRQAIEEEFILDVLKNYMTYRTSYQLAKEIEDNPELPKTEAVKAIARYQSLHPWSLAQKTSIMVEQFRSMTRHAIGGKAKAMVVTPSRLHAVRYMEEFKKYIAQKGYNDLDVLVAFSGSVTDGDLEYTEPSLNVTKDGEHIKENQLKEAFHTDDFNILIVAEKYQTGFDEPLLHTMFVDKKLRGVKAVQTLSRLNRTTAGKRDTFILDFVNSAQDIQDSFQPFYERTSLDEEININLIYDVQVELKKYNVYNQDDITKVMNLVKQAQKKQDERLLGRISSQFKPIVQRYKELIDDQKYEFRVTLRKFGKLYNYISQLDRTFDMELLEESIFTEYLLKFIPEEERETIDIEDKIRLEYYKLQESFSGDIQLIEEEPAFGQYINIKSIDAQINHSEERDSLDEIIHQINDRFPDDFTASDKVIIETLYKAFAENPDPKLIHMAKNNDVNIFEKSLFRDTFTNKIIDEYASNQQAFEKLLNSDKAYFEIVYSTLAKELYNSLKSM
ncbi:type I restriction endonuclease subunit R [Streptococcus mutans]|uniref:type I restriction endonuclease subunit R n=1 Tax=Streptococcus mutans TaxID=1309 RepID=UPI00145552E0|nr:type I restriction endonuclease [Streptococcus mutans]MCY7123159.1 DEAD/DEAH box helicase family protein [Streptococcus mutans]NLR05606.1 type I restriction endonuclease subunit R [Streptococcus mutans]